MSSPDHSADHPGPDLTDRLDRSFGGGPDHRPVESQVAAGRRALWRRRALAATGGVAVAAIVGGTALIATGGDDLARGVDPAASPSSSPSPEEGRSASAVQDPVGYDSRGELVYADGVEVVQRIANPLHRREPRGSDGVELRIDGATTYWLLDRQPDGYMTSSDPAGKNMGSLEEWLVFQAQSQGGSPTDGLVDLAADGTVSPGPGAAIVEQRTGVEVGESFAPAGATTAAVLVERDGVRWWVLARRLDRGPAEYFPVSLEVGGDDLRAFLEHSRTQYDGGEGLR